MQTKKRTSEYGQDLNKGVNNMKALVLKGKCKVDYEDVETPKCPKGGLLLKIEAVGLC